MPRTIVIVEVEENDFMILEGEGCITKLCWDEVLPIVAKMLIVPDKKVLRKIEEPYQLESRLRRELREQITEEIMSQLRPVDILLLAQRAG